MDKFEPSTPFEGWLKAEIDNLNKDFANHIRHHEKLEWRLFTWGTIVVGMSIFLGWVLRGIIG